jgi:hypothetical protein
LECGGLTPLYHFEIAFNSLEESGVKPTALHILHAFAPQHTGSL